mmetsp:Transcript_24826/g.51953  ORF Transcript_24826/g.51953 Transcript_24826/m.51953 type:complete len:832 (-) Transcript_24826:141-2636(-)
MSTFESPLNKHPKHNSQQPTPTTMDELLSLFGTDDGSSQTADREASDEGHQHHERPTETTGTSSSDANGKDFGSAFGDAFGFPDDGTTSNSIKAATPSHHHHRFSQSAQPKTKSNPYSTTKTGAATATATKNNNNNNACDPMTGLRIVDRRTSRANMIDAFSSLTYKSCSVIAAASRADWNSSYLVDGGNNGGGKTNLATCGILTNDASSRLSKTGRAFAILSLGDLPSSMHARGSCNSSANAIAASVTVFLFGDALGVLRSNKKYMNPGWAVAVLGPSLMPPRGGNDNDKHNAGATSVTLSVNDPRQILAIGKAADCGRCKGTVRMRVKNDYGGSSWDDVRCRTLVDLRLGGGYCHTHRRQGLSSSGNGNGGTASNGSGSNKNANMTFMQRQRMQSLPQNTSMNGGHGVRPNARNQAPGQASSSHLAIGGRTTASSSLSEALSRSGLFELAPPTSLQPASKAQLLKRAPLHMKKAPSSASTVSNPNASKATHNPYLKDKPGYRSQGSVMSTKRKEPGDILGKALERKRMRMGNSQTDKTSTSKRTSTIGRNHRPCKVFNTEGYDGAVQVPKPNKVLFQRHGTTATPATPSPEGNRLTVDSARAILEKQRSMAGLFRQERGGVVADAGKRKLNGLDKDSLARSKRKILVNGKVKSLPTAQKSRPTSFVQINKATDFASAFGSTAGGDCSSSQPFDREAIFNAKSKFASEANAQEYARARAVVQELEAKESKKEGNGGSSKKKNDESKAANAPAIVTSGWTCRTCRKTTPFKPVSCIRSRHDVRQRRELKGGVGSLGSRKERLDRHGRDSMEGGLTLGSGVEWSGWQRGGLG